MSTPERVANLIRLLEDQPSTLEWFPSEQSYLREHQPPTLIVWGPHDGYMPEKSARRLPSRPARRSPAPAPRRPLAAGDAPRRVVPLVEDFLLRSVIN
jgi:pimeloyl-ACP methyl ester carboxylesterase